MTMITEEGDIGVPVRSLFSRPSDVVEDYLLAHNVGAIRKHQREVQNQAILDTVVDAYVTQLNEIVEFDYTPSIIDDRRRFQARVEDFITRHFHEGTSIQKIQQGLHMIYVQSTEGDNPVALDYVPSNAQYLTDTLERLPDMLANLEHISAGYIVDDDVTFYDAQELRQAADGLVADYTQAVTEREDILPEGMNLLNGLKGLITEYEAEFGSDPTPTQDEALGYVEKMIVARERALDRHQATMDALAEDKEVVVYANSVDPSHYDGSSVDPIVVTTVGPEKEPEPSGYLLPGTVDETVSSSDGLSLTMPAASIAYVEPTDEQTVESGLPALVEAVYDEEAGTGDFVYGEDTTLDHFVEEPTDEIPDEDLPDYADERALAAPLEAIDEGEYLVPVETVVIEATETTYVSEEPSVVAMVGEPEGSLMYHKKDSNTKSQDIKDKDIGWVHPTNTSEYKSDNLKDYMCTAQAEEAFFAEGDTLDTSEGYVTMFALDQVVEDTAVGNQGRSKGIGYRAVEGLVQATTGTYKRAVGLAAGLALAIGSLAAYVNAMPEAPVQQQSGYSAVRSLAAFVDDTSSTMTTAQKADFAFGGQYGTDTDSLAFRVGAVRQKAVQPVRSGGSLGYDVSITGNQRFIEEQVVDGVATYCE